MSAFECPPTPPDLPEGEAAITPPPKSGQGVEDAQEQPSSQSNKERRPSSPDPGCAICLGHLENMSYTDACFHKFCFVCLVEWSKVKPVCPLCKAKFKNIIHNIKSDDSYDQYPLPPPPPRDESGILVGDNDDGRRFRYRTTLPQFADAARFLYETNDLLRIRQIEATMNTWREQLPVYLPPRSEPVRSSARSLWTRRRGAATSEFRRDIYRRNLYVDPESVSDITGRYRDCSPAWYRTNPAQTHRLVPWLNRELNALLEGSEHQSAYVTQKILQLIGRFDIRSPEFHEKLLPYLGNRTDHFQHEFYHFARSVYDMIGYDRNATYTENNQLAAQVVSSGTSDDEDDVQVVDEVPAPPPNLDQSGELPQLLLNMGPSTSSGISSSSGPIPRHVIPSSDDSSSYASDNDQRKTTDGGANDDIEVVGFVKPRHERTPVIIDISSGDEAKIMKSESQPQASQESEMIEISSSSESNQDGKSSSSAPKKRRPSDFLDAATARAEIRRILDADRFARRRIMTLFKEVGDRVAAQLDSTEDQGNPGPSSSSQQHSEDVSLSSYKGKGKGKGKSSRRSVEVVTPAEPAKKKKKSKKKKQRPAYEDDASSEGESQSEAAKKSKRKKKSKKKKKKQQLADSKSKKQKKKHRVRTVSSSSSSSSSIDTDDKPLSKWKVSVSSRSCDKADRDQALNNPSSSSNSAASFGGSNQNEDLRLFLSRKRPAKAWSTSDTSDSSDFEGRPKKKMRSIVCKVDKS